MASQEQRDALRTGRKDAQVAVSSGTSAKFRAPTKAAAHPLEDETEQDAILNPPALAATIGGEPVEIHELAARHARALTLLMRAAFIDLFSGPRSSDVSLSSRLAALLADRYCDQILPFIARSTAAAGEIAEIDIPRLAEEIDKKLQFDEMAQAIALILNANRIIEALTPKKVGAKNG